jgi:hypothetical protein
MIKLSGLRLEDSKDGAQVRLCADLEHAGDIKPLWFSLDAEYRDCITADRYDAFLTAVLLYAMELGEEIVVEGAVSERLCYAYRHHLGPEVAVLQPVSKVVPIHVASYSRPDAGQRGQAVATGFTGGIDSMFTVLRQLGSDVPPGYRISHLLFTNIGTHGNSHYGDIAKARQLYCDRKRIVRAFAKEAGFDLVEVDSNLHEHLPWRLLSNVITSNIAVAQALQGLFRRFYYPAQFQLAGTLHWEPGDLDSYSPKLVTEMSTEILECRSTDSHYSRIEKTAFLADESLARKYLNVCVTVYGVKGRNCTTDCVKCARTAVTLDLLGRLEDFRDVFDLEKYARNRTRLFRRVLAAADNDVFAAQIVAHARNTGLKWPVAVKLGVAAKRGEQHLRKWLSPLMPPFRALRKAVLGRSI